MSVYPKKNVFAMRHDKQGTIIVIKTVIVHL